MASLCLSVRSSSSWRGEKKHKTCSVSTQTGDGTDTTPQTSSVNQCGATPRCSGDPAASPRDSQFVRAMTPLLILLLLTFPDSGLPNSLPCPSQTSPPLLLKAASVLERTPMKPSQLPTRLTLRASGEQPHLRHAAKKNSNRTFIFYYCYFTGAPHPEWSSPSPLLTPSYQQKL